MFDLRAILDALYKTKWPEGPARGHSLIWEVTQGVANEMAKVKDGPYEYAMRFSAQGENRTTFFGHPVTVTPQASEECLHKDSPEEASAALVENNLIVVDYA